MLRHPDRMADPARAPATEADFFAIPEHERWHELFDSELVVRAAPTGEHSDAQSGVASVLKPKFQRRPGGPSGPGGWWIYTEIEVRLLATRIVRPDVCGWRRERMATRPVGTPIELRPDWVCEVLSPSNANEDLVRKLNLYLEAEIPHYWIVDPRDETLTVHRRTGHAWTIALRAERHEVVRAEPFDAIEFPIGVLFGDDPP
jgi:Uma2 family endonuclease